MRDFEDEGGPLELHFTQFHPMPGGHLKLCILWDETSQMFWAIADLVLDSEATCDW